MDQIRLLGKKDGHVFCHFPTKEDRIAKVRFEVINSKLGKSRVNCVFKGVNLRQTEDYTKSGKACTQWKFDVGDVQFFVYRYQNKFKIYDQYKQILDGAVLAGAFTKASVKDKAPQGRVDLEIARIRDKVGREFDHELRAHMSLNKHISPTTKQSERNRAILAKLVHPTARMKTYEIEARHLYIIERCNTYLNHNVKNISNKFFDKLFTDIDTHFFGCTLRQMAVWDFSGEAEKDQKMPYIRLRFRSIKEKTIKQVVKVFEHEILHALMDLLNADTVDTSWNVGPVDETHSKVYMKILFHFFGYTEIECDKKACVFTIRRTLPKQYQHLYYGEEKPSLYIF